SEASPGAPCSEEKQRAPIWGQGRRLLQYARQPAGRQAGPPPYAAGRNPVVLGRGPPHRRLALRLRPKRTSTPGGTEKWLHSKPRGEGVLLSPGKLCVFFSTYTGPGPGHSSRFTGPSGFWAGD